MKKFRVNDYIVLKLEENKTNIYIKKKATNLEIFQVFHSVKSLGKAYKKNARLISLFF